MINELLCMETIEGERKISIAKVLVRVTYCLAGFGVGVGSKAIAARVSNNRGSKR